MSVETKETKEDLAKALKSSFLTKLIYNHFYLLVTLVIAAGGVRETWLFAALIVAAFLGDIWRRRVLANNSEMLHECLLNRDDPRVKRQHLIFTIVLVGSLVVYPVSILLFKSWYPEDMNAFFSFFQPVYDALGHVVPIITKHPIQLIEHGYVHRVPVVSHIYGLSFLTIIFSLFALGITPTLGSSKYFVKNLSKETLKDTRKFMYFGIAIPMPIYIIAFALQNIDFKDTLSVRSWTVHVSERPLFLLTILTFAIIAFSSWAYYFACLIEYRTQELDNFQIKGEKS